MRGPLTIDCSVIASPRVAWREVQGEAVLLDLDSGQYFGLDEVGNRIWHLLQSRTTLRRVRTRLVREYDVDESEVEADILELVEEFVEHGLVALVSE